MEVKHSQWNVLGNLQVGNKGKKGDIELSRGGVLNTGGNAVIGTKTGTGAVFIGNGSQWNVVGNFTQAKLPATAGVEFDIAGTAPAQFGQLNIKGSGTFNNLILIDFIKHFAPQKGQTWDLINVPSATGFKKANIGIAGLKPGFKCSVSYANGQFVLKALSNGISGTGTIQHCTGFAQ
jgi:hypothetical protein